MPTIKQPKIHTKVEVYYSDRVSRFTVPYECEAFPSQDAIVGYKDTQNRTHAINLSQVQEVVFEPFALEAGEE
jgi:hypothetical protein